MQDLVFYAALKLGNPFGGIEQVEDSDALSEYITGLYNFLLPLAALSAVLMIVWGGYQYFGSMGDPTKMTNAKETILSALIGLALLMVAGLIVSTIGVE